MKKPLQEQAAIPQNDERFNKKKLMDNIRRGEILAKVTIGFELLLILADVSAAFMRVDNRFQFGSYFFMYSALVVLNLLFLLGARVAKKVQAPSARRLRLMNAGILVYLTLTMTWGSVMSLMDQKLYSQLTAFIVTLMISSVLFFLDRRERLVPFAVSVLTLTLGLPFFQSSQDVLIGSYVNLAIFIVTAWIASDITYQNFVNDVHVNTLLEASKAQLEHEIEENQEMNRQLIIANQQLKKMALLDELTGVPNRRGFRNYVDIVFDKYAEKAPVFTVLLIDIDHFKQYNDHCGHEVGDQVLVEVSRLLDSIPKVNDLFFCRWGGDEFVISQLNITDEKARELAETIRLSVQKLQVSHNLTQVNGSLSISIGIGTIKAAGKRDVSRVMRLADGALFRAKSNGRNRVESNPEENPPIKA